LLNECSMLKRKTAFTLLEVMIVVGIIAILAAIILPVTVNARRSGERTVALSNLSQIGKAVFLYTSDNDTLFPYACSADDRFTKCPGETPSNLPLIDAVLSLQTKSRDVWRDPLDTGIPQVSTGEFSEPIECELPGSSPSLYTKFGSSFVYRLDLAVDHVPEPFELIEDGSNRVLDQSQVAIIYDAYGNWHGGPDVPSKKVCTLYGDGHAKVSDLVSIHAQGTFRKRP
jgi:prepilin-type N-terminal cleavage/methylation domain-containing protein